MPAVTRIGDSEIPHCSPMVRAQGSENVFANSIGISRQGDLNTVHLLPGTPCPAHVTPIITGDPTVFINNKQCGRVGDPTCTAVAVGSPNVFANEPMPTPPPPPNAPETTTVGTPAVSYGSMK